MKKFAIAAVAACVATGVYAADSELGATSTDTIPLTLDIPALVRVSAFTGIDLGTFDGATAETGTDDGCIYSNDKGAYTVTMTSTNTAFKLISAALDEIPYAVQWCDDVAGGGDCVALVYNTESAAQAGADTLETDCVTGGNNASVQVDITVADMLAAPIGTYEDDLLVLISPDE